MKETEICEAVIQYFEPLYEVFKEVPCYGGYIDIVAKSGKITIGIEAKCTLSFAVIEQAKRTQPFVNYSYIAVPHHKASFAHTICRDYGIGIISYHPVSKQITEIVKPRMMRTKQYGRLCKLTLLDYMKQSEAGSQNNRKTAFSNTIDEMVKHIKRHPGCTLKECLESVHFHWSSLSSAKGCVYQWIQKGVITQFKLENGKLFLTGINKPE